MTEIRDKIISRGYWEVVIRPTRFEKFRIETLPKCKEIISSSAVSLRGWNYPHVKNPGNMTDWVEDETDWHDHIEHWRFYQSGQFIHLFGCREDWIKDLDTGKGLEIINTLYKVTEVYEFAARLAGKGFMGEDIQIKISLKKMNGRQLFFWDSERYLSGDYICKMEELPLDRTLQAEKLLAGAKNYALYDFRRIMNWFNWDNVPTAVFVEDQNKLLERRM